MNRFDIKATMTRKQKPSKILSLVAAFIVLVSAVLFPLSPARAAQMTARSLTLSNSAGAATGVGYTFAFTPPTSTTIKSVRIDICDSASGTCSPPSNIPSGFSSSSAAVGTISGIGSGGSWTGTFTTNGRIDLANASNTGSPTTVSIQITGITNPTVNNSAFYARMTTYSASNWTSSLDTGTVVASTASQIAVTASVDETLTFCAGTSGITNSSCAGVANSTIQLGTLTTSSTASGTSQLGVSTNSTGGYAITINGSTLTSGGNNIDAMTGASDTSAWGSEQFGINLKNNATPDVGSDPDGSGTGTPAGNYGDVDEYYFSSGTTVASKGSGTESFRRYTVSYIANISGVTAPGIYTGTYTYICTATF